MTVPIKLLDGKSGIFAAGVTEQQEVLTIVSPYPPLVPQRIQPFRQFFTADGLTTGSNDLAVDGSSTNVEFFIPSHENRDRYISSLSFIVGYGTSAQPNEWADGTALTNGIQMYYTSARGEVDIHEGIKTNQDLFRLKTGGTDANWEVRHVNANNDFGYFVVSDFQILFATPHGIKIDAGTTEKLVIKIRDNMTTSTDSFNCIAYGFDRF